MKLHFIKILMVSFFSNLIFMALPSLALASSSVFKIQSYLCDLPHHSVRQGSGVLIEDSGRSYILTAAHVPYPSLGDERFCHEAICLDGVCPREPIKLRQHSYNSFNDLALFEIVSEADAEFIASRAVQLDSHPVDSRSSYYAAGYAFASRSKTIDNKLKILTMSERHPFSMLDQMIEVQSSLEFGMSGGGVFANDSDKLVGIISSQALRAQSPGDIPDFAEIANEDNEVAKQHVIRIELIIPASEIQIWLNKTLVEPDAYTPDLDDFMKGKLSIQLGYIKFTQLQDCGSAINSPIGGDGIGIGGDGIGIGGDGIGIGGSEDDDEPCGILLQTTSSPGAEWPFDQTRPWFLETQKQVMVHGDLIIRNFADAGTLVPTRSLPLFFRQLAEGHIPLRKSVTIDNATVDQLQVLASSLKSFVELFRQPNNSKATEAYLDSAHFIAEVIVAEQFDLIDRVKLDALIGIRESNQSNSLNEARNYLFNTDEERAIGLVRTLYEISNKLRDL